MNLTKHLRKEYITLDGEFSTKEEIIEHMIEKFYSSYKFDIKKEEILNSIQHRESLGGTDFPNGILIPHARLENFKDVLVGVYVPKKPIKTDDLDAKVVLMFLLSRETSNIYLKSISTFIEILHRKDVFQKLLACKDINCFFNIVQESEQLIEAHKY